MKLIIPGVSQKPFKPPFKMRTPEDIELAKRMTLGIPKGKNFMKFIEVGTIFRKLEIEISNEEKNELVQEPSTSIEVQVEYANPLRLWHNGKDGDESHYICVDSSLCQYLRPHQRDGIQFMFECVMGLRNFNGNGCILADDMGLGKTLQSISIIWTLLEQGFEKGKGGEVKRCIVICPKSMVGSWKDEIHKWLGGRCKCIALNETSKEQVISSVKLFLLRTEFKVLILSYDTFRIHENLFTGINADMCCDLLVCDEAHRLKNGATRLNQALASLRCRKRILLTGTPMQNDLEEFFTMVDFTNPGILGDQNNFRRKYLNPILIAREPNATDEQRNKAQVRQNELSAIVSKFILRRTNSLNAKHLPPKLVQVVVCRLTDIQQSIYLHILNTKEITHILQGQELFGSIMIFPYLGVNMLLDKPRNILTTLKNMQKLCNHPKLLLDGLLQMKLDEKFNVANKRSTSKLLDKIQSLLPKSTDKRSKSLNIELSGKMDTLYRLMNSMRRQGNDKIVIVSNYTSTLDYIGLMCREYSWPFCRLDGSTNGKRRKGMVAEFNDPNNNLFAFLLSSKAGGCGINLIGANRLVLFDPDWNPATDKQAAARVWRDGQKKRCFVYRFITTGTIEEKIFQRQLSKEGLKSIVEDEAEVNNLSSKQLKNLFNFNKDTASDTHDKLHCSKCNIGKAFDYAEQLEAEAISMYLPQQLRYCKELLDEIQALPEAKEMNATHTIQLGSDQYGIVQGKYDQKCGEKLSLPQISQKLQQSLVELHNANTNLISSSKNRGTDCSIYRESGNFLATSSFASDMRVALNVTEKALKNEMKPNKQVHDGGILFDYFLKKWKELIPSLIECKDQAYAEVHQKYTVAAKENSPSRKKFADQYKEQTGMPKEEDLNNWSHHFTTDTIDDLVFRSALAGTSNTLVTFIFGLEVTWDRIQTQLDINEEEEEDRNGSDTPAADVTNAAHSDDSDHSIDSVHFEESDVIDLSGDKVVVKKRRKVHFSDS